jgi:hypothetical protein
MTDDDRKIQLLNVERRFWDAMRDKDATTARGMTDEVSIIVGAQGVSAIDPRSMAQMLEGATWELKRYDFDESSAQVRRIGDDVAIVAYTVREQLVVDGAPLTLEANDASVWVRRDGDWVCALHTESVAGDAFGRDRQPATAATAARG